MRTPESPELAEARQAREAAEARLREARHAVVIPLREMHRENHVSELLTEIIERRQARRGK